MSSIKISVFHEHGHEVLSLSVCEGFVQTQRKDGGIQASSLMAGGQEAHAIGTVLTHAVCTSALRASKLNGVVDFKAILRCLIVPSLMMHGSAGG